jgi:hypothetical protein
VLRREPGAHRIAGAKQAVRVRQRLPPVHADTVDRADSCGKQDARPVPGSVDEVTTRSTHVDNGAHVQT